MKKDFSTGLPRPVEAVLAVSGLIALSPLMLLVAVLIKFFYHGPVLFSQRRVGLNGREFTLYKFRTMRSSKTGPLVTAATDKRITRLGRLLRQTKIDELPELWNILRGEMSFVGPRPEVPEFVDLNDPLWKEILQARPGLTDPVTLKLRNEETLLANVADKEAYYREFLQPYKVKGYVNFVRKRSWKADLKIIYKTVKLVVVPRVAHLPTHEEIRLLIFD